MLDCVRIVFVISLCVNSLCSCVSVCERVHMVARKTKLITMRYCVMLFNRSQTAVNFGSFLALLINIVDDIKSPMLKRSPDLL